MNENTNTWQTPGVHPVIQAVKDAGSSPLFLTMVILHTIMLIVRLVNIFTFDTSSFYQLFYSLDRLSGYSLADISDLADIMSGTAIATSLLALVPTILVCVGLWICYGTSKKAQSPFVSTAGLTMLQVVAVIRLILISLLVVLVALLMIPLIAAVSHYSRYSGLYSFTASSSAASLGIFGVILIITILLAIFTLIIIYYAKLITTLSAIRSTARTAVPSPRISGFYIVMNFILAGFNVLSSLFSLIGGFELGSIMNLLLSAVWILASIILMRYKAQMRAMIAPPVQSIYPQNPQPFQ